MMFMLLLTFAHAKETRLHTVAAAAETNVCEILGDKAYADLGDALAAVKNGQTIKLLQNINYNKNDGIVIYNKSITFDLNGFNLNVVADETALSVFNDGSEVKLTGKGEFNVTSNGRAGVLAQYGGKATVTNITGSTGGASAGNNSSIAVLGNVTTTYDGVTYYCSGVSAFDNASITVHGNVTLTSTGNGDGINANDAIITVNGDVTGNLNGIYARNNATVTVTGNVTTTGGNRTDRGVDANNYANVTVGGNVNAKFYGVYAQNGSVVKVTGNTTGDNSTCSNCGPYIPGTQGEGIRAISGSNVSVGGDAIGVVYGICAYDNATVTVSGSATGQYGIQARSGSNVSVTGVAKGTYDGISASDGANVTVTEGATGVRFGVYASGNNTTVTVSGDVSGSVESGVYAGDNSHVTVSGDVIGGRDGLSVHNATVIVDGSVTGNISGIQTMDGATITISGDVTGVDGVRIQMGGSGNMTAQSYYYDKAEVTIDGQIKILNDGAYILFYTTYPLANTGFELTHDDNQPTSSKQGYLEYTDGFNYVWVKGDDITGTDIIPQPSSTLKAYIQNGRLHVSGLTVGDLWTVYNLSGMIVHQNRAAAEEADINLPAKGIYIIVSARQSTKAGNF